jgi:quinol monooxygenase YgiN
LQLLPGVTGFRINLFTSLFQNKSSFITFAKIITMKIVRVQYTTRSEYAATNQENIQRVANELRQINHPGIKYACYLLPDGKTFMHFDQFENEEAHQALMSLESFKKFSTDLWASNLEVEPKLELPSLVAASFDFFG